MTVHNTPPSHNDTPKTVAPGQEVGLHCASGKDISSAGEVTDSDFELPGMWTTADLSGGWADSDQEAPQR